MDRKLATIRKINDLQPIEGADKIEKAIVGGWNVVVAKEVGHKVGDLVVYCEIDSLLPVKPEYEFLRKSSYKKFTDGSEGFRLKSMKLRGVVSQGLILPLKEVIPEFEVEYMNEGDDVTEFLGITKFEPSIPVELSGDVEGVFPSFIKKTDEERVQNLSSEYESLKEDEYDVSEKLDGTSFTSFLNEGVFGVCSRNWWMKYNKDNTYFRFTDSVNLEEKLKELNKNICLQGELIGEGIQGNKYKIKGHTVKFFNVFDIDTQRYLNREESEMILGILGLEMVPLVAQVFKLPNTISELLEYAEGKSLLNKDTEREGIVIRTKGKEVSFKAISNKWLLKNE